MLLIRGFNFKGAFKQCHWGTPRLYKEGGFYIKFETFDGSSDKLKALTFIQHFDAAYQGRKLQRSFKAMPMLKKNALQW